MEPPKPTLLLPNAALTKAKEAGHRAVRITDLKISDGTSTNRSARLIGTKMAEAGLRIEDGHSVIGPGLAGSRDRSATMIAVVAVEEAADRQVKQAADMQPTSLNANFMLEDFGGFSFQQPPSSSSRGCFIRSCGGGSTGGNRRSAAGPGRHCFSLQRQMSV